MRKLIGFLLFSVQLSGQLNIPDKQFTTHHGLPQIQVTDILQDQRGYIWVSTKKGVARFNGESFTPLGHPVLDHTQVNFMLEDAKSRLYFFYAGKKGQVLQYDGCNFKHLELKNLRFPQSFRCHIVDNELLVTNGAQEVNYYDLDSMVYKRTIEISDTATYFFKTKDNEFWTSGPSRKEMYNLQTHERRVAPDNHFFGFLLNEKNNGRITQINKNPLNVDIAIYDPTFEKQTTRFTNFISNNDKKTNFQFPNDDAIFIQSSDTLLKIKNKSIVDKYLISNTTRALVLQDIDENIWVSHENGIDFFSKTKITSYPRNIASDIWAINSIDDKFYYTSYTRGFYELDLNKNKSKRLFPPRSDRYNYSSCTGQDGHVYFSGSNYLHEFDGANFKQYPLGKLNQNLMNYYDVEHQRLIVGANKCIGHLNKDKIDFFRNPSDSCLSRYVVAMDKKSTNEYWIGTYNELVSFDFLTKRYHSHNHVFQEGASGAITLCNDTKGNLWIGNKHGLWHLNKNENLVKPIYQEAFKGEFVMALKELPNNLLAIGTSNGFSVLDLAKFYSEGKTILKNYNNRNGFKGEEVSQNGFFIKDSLLFIPSSTYLSSIPLSDLDFSSDHSQVSIIRVNEKNISWINGQNEIITKNNDLSIDFEGIGFNQPHESRFSYILEGHDDTWSEWSSNSSATYQNLSGGSYLFKVRKQTSIYDNAIDYPGDGVNIKIDIPLYKGPNFYKYAFIGLLIFSSLFIYLLFNYWKTNAIRKEQEEKIKYLEIQALQSQLNPHFIFNVLGTIQSLILNNQTEEANKYLVSFSKLIRRFLDSSVSNNLGSNNINSNNNITLEEEIELLTLYIEFEMLQYADKFDYSIETANVDILNLNIPPMIIQPYVENAIKHGLMHAPNKGKLNLSFKETEDVLICTVEDDGVGRARVAEIQARSRSIYKSQGTHLVKERIKILNKPHQKISIKTIDKVQPEKGTKVIIEFDKQFLI